MRFFKHGDVLAVSLPESLRKKMGVSEGDEFDFVDVSNNVVALVRKTASSREEKPAAVLPGALPVQRAAAVTQSLVPQKPKIRASPEAIEFARRGYAVLDNEVEAKRLSEELEQFVKSGQVVGVRGFDRRFYVVSKQFFESASAALLLALKEASALQQASVKAKLPFEACAAVLAVLKEQGDVIEKKKGLFQAV
ncbi:hypothetical protein COX86_03755 [Candidatus Micrarchaeota archaeon CG_4_10_14_0_2_um_filter_60_11]|nr:MAG: hypothetical protein AUJ16_02345 [Candidatus Micrarchaeota archaeon CG1_02_60_51]PIN96586.1 MAG: hypothetical protein COU39_00585 [Candidatus Micrarchaeota archaeon CG10_big_fil_rev_8_21_14_0_10_60_32]PIO02189.1 MAG: hypothetical protein COT58_01270 [Candidatus Micrarchaeota archaeon CG09_land_8_20_14_0_10_60_16]PIY91604.1 MAG: hypothetical protein COY71_02315 [Candidatus Micrarchaeota archaeon CG_4_10_14_0_8_um_filter_60_7]PIZ90658.1 MAG: hypothetical protein COX86_03755 [Candidatus Mi